MRETKTQELRDGAVARLTLWIIIAVLMVLLAVGAAISLLTAPEPEIMAPGPNYSTEEPREDI